MSFWADDKVKWKAVKAPRNAKSLKMPYVTHTGTTRIGTETLECVTLSDGNRLITKESFERLFGPSALDAPKPKRKSK
jgi:predicted peroxiredoxin